MVANVLNKLSEVEELSVVLPYLKIVTINKDQQGISLQKLNNFFAIAGRNCMLSRSPELFDM